MPEEPSRRNCVRFVALAGIGHDVRTMTMSDTQEALEQLAAIRRRIDYLRDDWDAHGDSASVIHSLNDLSARSAAFPSIRALLLGAAELIERGEEAGHRLEKLSDHLHGYTVGWEDAADAGRRHGR